VRVSFDIPEYTSDVTGVGTIRILEAIAERIASRFLQHPAAKCSGSPGGATNEKTPFWAAQPLWCSQVFFVLGNRELSREL